MNLISRNQFNSFFSRTLGRNFFLSSFIILWVYYILLYPTLSFNAQLYGELGNNYLYYAYNETFGINIWKDDAGYLVWLPRFIALFCSVFFTPAQFVYVVSFTALAFSAFFVAFINHTGFRILIQNDEQRFWLSLLFGMVIMPMYELFTFINFSYIGFVFISFLLLLNKEKLSPCEYKIYAWIAALLCISKLHFLVFFPIFLFAIGEHLYKKDHRAAWFYIPAIITMLIQIGYVMINAPHSSFVANATVYNSSLIKSVLQIARGLMFWTTAYATNFRFLIQPMLVQAVGMLFFAFLLYQLIKSWKNKEISNNILVVFILFNIISLGYGLMGGLVGRTWVADAFLYNDYYPLHRRGFVSYDLIWFACFFMLFHVKTVYIPWYGTLSAAKNISLRTWLMRIFLLLSLIVTIPKFTYRDLPELHTRRRNVAHLSDWKHLNFLFNQDKYFIPTDPYPTGLYITGIHQGVKLSRLYISYTDEEGDLIGAGPAVTQRLDKVTANLFIPQIYEAGQKVISVMIEDPTKKAAYITAYDAAGNALGQGRLLSDKQALYKYFLFDEVVTPMELTFFDQDGHYLQDMKWVAVYVVTDEERNRHE